MRYVLRMERLLDLKIEILERLDSLESFSFMIRLNQQNQNQQQNQQQQNQSQNQNQQNKSQLSDKKTERMLDELVKKEMETKKKLDGNKGKSSKNTSGKDW